MKIKVGYLLSYDYDMFLTSVKQLYDHVDKIVVGIDKNNLTWAGNKYTIPQSFFDEIRKFDKRNIIEIYFDKFYIPTLSPMECESRERNMVLKKLGRGWKIQLDVDEYIVDFKELKKYLKKYNYLNIFPQLTPICFKGKLVTLFKQTEAGYLYMNDKFKFPFITNQNVNSHTRFVNNAYNHYINIQVIHQSWARNIEEIELKVKNWGHKNDFDVYLYLNFWKSINHNNYTDINNFHPINPSVWEKLFFLESDNIDDYISKFKNKNSENLYFIDVKDFCFFVFKNIIKRVFYYNKMPIIQKMHLKSRGK
jgi:hypothetical protein